MITTANPSGKPGEAHKPECSLEVRSGSGMSWKAILNAFAVTFGDRFTVANTC